MSKQYYVYIMTNRKNTVLYTGITNDLRKRVYEHKKGITKGFTRKYKIIKLVYFETYSNAYDAISREKQIKDGSRKKKVSLIESMNVKWQDLYGTL